MPLARDNQDMLTGEERRLLQKRRRRIVATVVFLFAAAILVVVAVRPTRDAIKSWQARRHAQKAFALIEQEKWPEAKDEAVAAYQLRQTEPQALRAVARFLSRTRQPQALQFWDQLAATSKLTHEDLRDEGTIAVVAGNRTRARAVISQLLADVNVTSADWLLAAQLDLVEAAPEEALRSLAKVLGNSKATRREQFNAALLQLQAAHSTNAELNAQSERESWQRLIQLARDDDAVGLDSLVILAQRQLSPANENSDIGDSQSAMEPDELVHRLQTHPLSKAPQKLLAIDLQIKADATKRDALIAKAIDEFQNSDNESLTALARWLNGKGEYERELDAIPLERAAQNRDVFLQHLDALGALGRWTDIEQLLVTERFPLDQSIQHMYLARCNAQLGQPEAAKNEWQRALEATAGDPGKLMALAEYAEKNGATEIAESAYEQESEAAPKLRASWQGRLRLAQAAKDTKRMHEILAKMLDLWPDDTSIQNDEAYMRLLLLPNDDPADPEFRQIEGLAEELVRRSPSSLPHRTLLALARLKQQRPVAALQVYDGIQVAANALSASALAVHAAVLNANGHTDEARREIAQISADRLLPEEEAGVANLRE